MTAYKTQWTHKPIVLNKEQQTILNREIDYISEELEYASDLIFHTVFLENDDVVIITGKDNVKDTLFLTYYESYKDD